MLVTQKNFEEVLRELEKEAELGFDTETTCLPWWDNPWFRAAGILPRVFSMQFATSDKEFYFDFGHSADRLGDAHYAAVHARLTSNPAILWYIANAPFDMHHCQNHGITFAGTVHCTKAIARVMNNTEPSLKLEDLAEKYLEQPKLDVITLLKERGHETLIKKYGHNDKEEEVLHFDRLELSELVEYGNRDTRLCFDLGRLQRKRIFEMDKEFYEALPPQHDGRRLKLSDVMLNEYKLTKIVVAMGREGVLIDRKYTEEAYEHEVAAYRGVQLELDALAAKSGISEMDWNSAKQLKPLFDAVNEPYSYTEKGNASFDKEALEDSESQLAKLILKYRFHYKRAHTYFENFIWLADADGVIHADAQQAGTMFGRMSYWSPNLQNVPKRSDKEETGYKVRRCFIPKPGTLLADFDYKGAEYYMGMDYARETKVVADLIAGIDPHKRLAAEMDIADRDSAKTMQFRIFYGGGAGAVGRALGYKGQQAERIGKQKKTLYFERVPALAALMRQVGGGWHNGQKVIGVAESRGFIFSWLGRKLDYTASTSYKAFNGLIQGGVGDMTKVAMVAIDEILKDYKSKMILQVHDAIVLKLYQDELHLIPIIKEAMCKAYPHRVLPMAADAAFSDKSWAELQSAVPPVA